MVSFSERLFLFFLLVAWVRGVEFSGQLGIAREGGRRRMINQSLNEQTQNVNLELYLDLTENISSGGEKSLRKTKNYYEDYLADETSFFCQHPLFFQSSLLWSIKNTHFNDKNEVGFRENIFLLHWEKLFKETGYLNLEAIYEKRNYTHQMETEEKVYFNYLKNIFSLGGLYPLSPRFSLGGKTEIEKQTHPQQNKENHQQFTIESTLIYQIRKNTEISLGGEVISYRKEEEDFGQNKLSAQFKHYHHWQAELAFSWERRKYKKPDFINQDYQQCQINYLASYPLKKFLTFNLSGDIDLYDETKSNSSTSQVEEEDFELRGGEDDYLFISGLGELAWQINSAWHVNLSGKIEMERHQGEEIRDEEIDFSYSPTLQDFNKITLGLEINYEIISNLTISLLGETVDNKFINGEDISNFETNFRKKVVVVSAEYWIGENWLFDFSYKLEKEKHPSVPENSYRQNLLGFVVGYSF